MTDGHTQFLNQSVIEATEKCNKHSRQPIDLNFIAIPKDDWEHLERQIKRLTDDVKSMAT